MKVQSTLGVLNARISEINAFRRSWPGISMIIGGRISEFEKHNAVYIGILQEKGAALMAKYIAHEDGKPQSAKDADGKITGWVFNSAADEKAFNEEYDALMARECTIIY